MATSKTKTKQKAKSKRRNASSKREFDVSKYIQDINIGDLKLEAVLEGSSENMQAIADANKAMIDGYVDLAKRQYEMLKDLLEEATAIGGRKSDPAKQLKQLLKHAKKDLQDLLKMAKKTNAQAQKIIAKRTDANIKAWKKLIGDTRKKTSGKKPATKAKTGAKAGTPKKTAAKKPTAKKATAKRPAKTRTVAKAKSGRTVGVTQAAVLAAIRAGNSAPKDIANAMKANPVQVNKALSRYAQQGIVVRTQPGQYALK